MEAASGVLGPRTRRALEVPAEVDLSAGNPITVEGEDLGIPTSASVAPCHLIGHDHLVPSLDQPHELELLSSTRAGPAPLEVARAVQSDIDRARECELIGQDPLDEAAVAGREGEVELSRTADSVTYRHRHLRS